MRLLDEKMNFHYARQAAILIIPSQQHLIRLLIQVAGFYSNKGEIFAGRQWRAAAANAAAA